MAEHQIVSDTRVLFARQYLGDLSDVLRRLPLGDLSRALEVLERAYAERRQVFLAGNGGSAATASHMANDLSKTIAGHTPSRQPGFRAIALTDNVSLLTAWANDVGYDEIFAGQLQSLAHAGDVLIVISGSGNSKNVVRAATVARDMQLITIGLLGRDGGALASLVDIAIIVPAEDYGPIEDVHLMLDHLITSYFKALLRQQGSSEQLTPSVTQAGV